MDLAADLATSRDRPLGFVAGLAVAALLVMPAAAPAQIIRNYEDQDRRSGDDYYAAVTVSFEGATGNSEFVDTDLAGILGYYGTSHWIRVYPAYRLKRSEGETVRRDRSVHLRHSYIISERTRTFAFVQVQSEKSIQLDRRLLVGGGIRSRVLRLGSGQMDLGVGLMIDEERRTGRDTRSDLRGANLLSIYGHVGSVTLAATSYYQPVIDKWSDYRMLVQLTARVPIVEHLSLDVSTYWRRDSDPPPGIGAMDAGVLMGFRFEVD